MLVCEILNHDMTFEKARKTLVNLPVEINGKFDEYINNLIIFKVDVNKNLERVDAAPCTTIHTISRLSKGDTCNKRVNFLELDK